MFFLGQTDCNKEKKNSNYKLNKYNWRDLFFMHCFPFLHWIKFFSGCFRQFIFHLGDKKKLSLVALERWLSYTVKIVWELAWTDSSLVILDEWLSYRGGRISRFDCILSSVNQGI